MNKKTLRLLAIFAVLLIAVAAVYFLTRKPTAKGDKTITVTVVFEDGSEKVHTVKTDGEYLIDAIKDFVTGEDSSYGFFITGVDGVEAISTLAVVVSRLLAAGQQHGYDAAHNI